MKSKLLLASGVTALLFTLNDMYATSPKREFRSTWFTTHVNIDWPRTKGNSASKIEAQKADLINYLNGFEKINLNGICFQVRAQADAVYRSSYEPWSAVMTGTRGLDPGWDPLEFAVEECHKRGLECYAWINPYRWSTGPDYNTPQDKEFKEKGWVLSWGSYYVLNPALPEVRAHILKVCEEIVDKYPLDGVLFDDYFYPNNIPENSEAGDWNDYKNSGTTLSIGDWRRENINLFVREFKAMIEKNHPDMRFGISPAGVAGKSAAKFGVDPVPVKASDWQYNTIYSDPLAWLAEGSIDFISPQIYWTTTHSTAPYEPLCDWWSYVADKFGRHFYSSHSVSFLSGANTAANWKEVSTQVELNRKYAQDTKLQSTGSIYFSSKYFFGPTCSGLDNHLINSVYGNKSLVPVIPWKERTWFDSPEELSFDGKVLSWKKIEAPRSIMRYTVYAVPTSVSYDDAADPDGDGLSIEYLEKVCYDSKFELPAEHTKDYWYAVAAYDGLGYEYAPAVINYPEGTSQSVSLTSPEDGTTASWTQAFSWTAVKDGRYEIIFATDSAFSQGRVSYKSETNSLTIDLDSFKPSTKYFWKVTAAEPNKLASVSDVRSFTSPALTAAPTVELLSPNDGEIINDNIKFEWSPTEGIESYTLEISDSEDFGKKIYTTVTGVSTTSAIVNPSLLGRGNFCWRIVTAGPRMFPSASVIRKFSIEKLSIGVTEPGYTVKRDPATYETVDGINIENLWMRSVGLKNLSPAENGVMERSMVAVGDYVYLTKRSENAQGAKLTLEKYDGLTGEHVSSIVLGDEGNVPYYPLNTVMKDDGDNVLIANLTLNSTSNPVVVHLVDLASGALTEIANIKLSGLSAARVDHVSVRGDVTTGNFDIIFPLSSTDNVVRVTFTNNKPANPEIVRIGAFYPSTVSHFGIAPSITPLTRDEFLANGGGTGLGRFSFEKKDLIESFEDTPDVHAGATTANGSAFFTLGSRSYVLYPTTDYSDSNGGFKFGIAVTENGKFSGLKEIAAVPRDGLGRTNSSTASTPISTVAENNGVQRVYVYAVGNGLSAYRISDTRSGVTNVSTDKTLYQTEGLSVVFSKAVEHACLYTASGKQVAEVYNADRVTAPTAGIYILSADGTTSRVVLK